MLGGFSSSGNHVSLKLPTTWSHSCTLSVEKPSPGRDNGRDQAVVIAENSRTTSPSPLAPGPQCVSRFNAVQLNSPLWGPRPHFEAFVFTLCLMLTLLFIGVGHRILVLNSRSHWTSRKKIQLLVITTFQQFFFICCFHHLWWTDFFVVFLSRGCLLIYWTV